VKVWLENYQFDLETLAELLPPGNIRIETDGNGDFYLTANEIDNRPAGVPCYEVAPVVLQRINGLAREERVVSSGMAECPVSGGQHSAPGRTGGHGGMPSAGNAHYPPDQRVPVPSLPLPGPRYAALASVDADVAEVLEIMGRPEAPNWVDLYKVDEIIEYSGQLKMAMAGAGISSNRASVFVRTACHPDTGGPDARHGRSKQDPPKNPMPISQARER
jgi:hypothetical protein